MSRRARLFGRPCGKSFETQKGRNAHRGARGSCPAKHLPCPGEQTH